MRILAIEELAEYQIKCLARNGKISFFKAGGQWRFRKDDIDQWSKSYPFACENKKFKG
ncbi:MAG: helix-turn-helix domain-containing protein [Candidatus Saelkia tenebricola]|nr:helix-turn-helix domain-containing protein [Candidatus Saelkia tenebricola]